MHMMKGSPVTEQSSDVPLDPRRVFLASGQVLERKIGGRDAPGPIIVQRVVHADNAEDAYRRLEAAEPAFQALGMVSLDEYEETVRRLRAVVQGISIEWPVIGARLF
jgi:hypothetical protein